MTKVTSHLACPSPDYAIFGDADLLQRLFLLVAEGSYDVMKFLRQKKKKNLWSRVTVYSLNLLLS